MLETKRIEQYLALIALGILVLGSLLVIRPFLSAVLLALILTISTWPVYESLLGVLKGRKTLTAALVSLALSAALLLPLFFLVTSLGNEIADFSKLVRSSLEQNGRLPIPAWVGQIPYVGGSIASRWETFSVNFAETAKRVAPYLAPAAQTVLSLSATFGSALLEVCGALIISFIFFRDGVFLAEKLREVMVKLAGTRAEGLIRTAGFTLKSVVYGILGTAIVQGFLASIGFVIAGVPAAALLGLITSFLSLVPIGPPLVWIPAALWLFSNGETSWAIFMALWGVIVVSGSDNVVKPYLISKGSDLPLVLIFIGVLGGVIQFGFLGVFLGPTLLALVYSLIKEWINPPVSTRGKKELQPA